MLRRLACLAAAAAGALNEPPFVCDNTQCQVRGRESNCHCTRLYNVETDKCKWETYVDGGDLDACRAKCAARSDCYAIQYESSGTSWCDGCTGSTKKVGADLSLWANTLGGVHVESRGCFAGGWNKRGGFVNYGLNAGGCFSCSITDDEDRLMETCATLCAGDGACKSFEIKPTSGECCIEHVDSSDTDYPNYWIDASAIVANCPDDISHEASLWDTYEPLTAAWRDGADARDTSMCHQFWDNTSDVSELWGYDEHERNGCQGQGLVGSCSSRGTEAGACCAGPNETAACADGYTVVEGDAPCVFTCCRNATNVTAADVDAEGFCWEAHANEGRRPLEWDDCCNDETDACPGGEQKVYVLGDWNHWDTHETHCCPRASAPAACFERKRRADCVDDACRTSDIRRRHRYRDRLTPMSAQVQARRPGHTG